VEQYSNNNKNEFLWTLLANPANDAHLYAYNIQRLVNDFPQSGILQALLAHASDNKNLRQASVYFNARSLYKLVNAPSSFIGVPDEKIVMQPGIAGNGSYQHYETLAPEAAIDNEVDHVNFTEDNPVAQAAHEVTAHSAYQEHITEPEAAQHFTNNEGEVQHQPSFVETAENAVVEDFAQHHIHETPTDVPVAEDHQPVEHWKEDIAVPTHQPEEFIASAESEIHQPAEHWQEDIAAPRHQPEEFIASAESEVHQPVEHWKEEIATATHQPEEFIASAESEIHQPVEHWQEDVAAPTHQPEEFTASAESEIHEPVEHLQEDIAAPTHQPEEFTALAESEIHQPVEHWKEDIAAPTQHAEEFIASTESEIHHPAEHWQEDIEAPVHHSEELIASAESEVHEPVEHWKEGSTAGQYEHTEPAKFEEPVQQPAHDAHEVVAETEPVEAAHEVQVSVQKPVYDDDETYDEIVGIEDINFRPEAKKVESGNHFFSFDKEFGEHTDERAEEQETDTTGDATSGAGQAQSGDDTDHQDVSKYHDEKLPYSFLWWLDKTRKEHAQVYQPYVKPRPAPGKRPKKLTDELQQQYFENIFHITSVEELDKSTPQPQAPYNIKRKEQVIIERFIKEEPQIRPQSSDKLDNENKAKKSSEDRDEMVTETLAVIYSDQMLYHKAIASYKKLMLKFPEKSRYFADKIEQLEKKTN